MKIFMGRGMHTSYPKGTPLFIRLRDGNVIVGKFKDHKSGKVLLEDGQSINLSEVKSMSMRKLETSEQKNSDIKVNFRIKR